MPRGRKKIPTPIKRMKGTLRPDRQLADEYEAITIGEVPKAPSYLDEVAVNLWREICVDLIANKMLSSIDRSMLAVYCHEMSVYIECQEMMKAAETRVFEYKKADGSIKHVQVSALYTISNCAFKNALAIAREFGFTPASRTSIGTGASNSVGVKEVDMLGQLAKQSFAR